MNQCLPVWKSMGKGLALASLLFLFKSSEAHAQTGYFDPDSVKWTNIDTLGWKSSNSFLAFYNDTTLQKIRIDHIGNSSSTTIYQLLGDALYCAVFVEHIPAGHLSEEHYYFSGEKMIKGRIKITSLTPGFNVQEGELKNLSEKEGFVLKMYHDDLLRLKKAGFIK